MIIANGGFQTDAINAAKEFGFELYSLADIAVETNKKLMNISQLKYLKPALISDDFSLDVESPHRQCISDADN